MEFINSIAKIAPYYDMYIVDIYGVIYEGKNIILQAAKAIEFLLSEKKKVFFLSNFPGPASAIKAKLITSAQSLNETEFLADILENILIITSGDFFISKIIPEQKLGDNSEKLLIQPKYKSIFTSKVEGHHPLIEALNKSNVIKHSIHYTTNINKADCFLMLTYADVAENKAATMLDNMLREALECNLPCLCPNPDITAPNGDSVRYTPGFYAMRYKEMGGEVHMFGKPYAEFFHYALARSNSKNSHHTHRAIMIGDSIHNDIQGAHNIGIDSVLIAGNKVITDQVDPRPTYVMSTLQCSTL